MADHRPEQTRSNTNTENHRAVSTEVFRCYGFLHILFRICLMTACFGFISLIEFDGEEGRDITAGVGCFFVVISTILYIVVKIRLGTMNCNLLGSNNGGLSSTVEGVCWDTSPLIIVAVKNEDKLCFGEPQLVQKRRSPFLGKDGVPE